MAICTWLSAVAVLPLTAQPVSGVARRGPSETREEWLLAQPRLTLPALAPDLLAPGRSEVRVHFDWGNDFGWRQDVAGEQPRDRRFLVDGEHRTTELQLRRGLRPALELGVRVPLRWRGPGLLDGLIDWFHRFTRKLGLPDNERGRFERDRLRVLGRAPDGQPFAWTGGAGTGLGRVELSARVALTRAARAVDSRARASALTATDARSLYGAESEQALAPAAPPLPPFEAGESPRSFAAAGRTQTPDDADTRARWAVAFVPRVTLPTGSGPFKVPGIEAGAQLVAAHGLGERWDVFLGAGGTFGGPRRMNGLRYARARPHGFAALEWRPGRRLSLLAQLDAAGRLVEGVADYPALASYLRLAAQVDLGQRWRLSGGFSENVAHQQATTDFGIFLGLARRF